MAEWHDNTKPANPGSISLSKQGVLHYVPIEKAQGGTPFIALIIHEKPNGSIVTMIDYRWPASCLHGSLEED